jgi:hypothetical protein
MLPDGLNTGAGRDQHPPTPGPLFFHFLAFSLTWWCDMHGADCPTCGTHVELHFKPVSGLIWCPKCQWFFPPAGTEPLLKPDEGEIIEERNGENHDNS